jgi:acetolactate synthase-1/3 small subunit
MRHIISALVQNVPGVLSHISGMLASRGYNIDSLAVGETENPKLSRMTFVVVGDEKVQEQVLKQLQKIVTVVEAEDISADKRVERDLMLIKVEALPGARSKVLEMVNIFRAKVVDVSDTTMMIEVSGQESKLEGFVDTMRPFGIIGLVRSGVIALPRG